MPVDANGAGIVLPGIPTRRINGIEKPWDRLQIYTWILFPFIITHYFSFIYFLLWESIAAKVVLTILFILFTLSTGFFAGLTCIIDPADEVLCSANPPQYTEITHCYLCNCDVHISSKHCRFCDKCVVKFDHHCMWLNTCVGQKNYHYFLTVVASVFMLTMESLTLSLALMIESFAISSKFMDRIHHNRFHHFLGSPIPLAAVQTLLVISVVFFLALVSLLIQLGGFHVVLLYRGMTTYDFIIEEQKKHRERETAQMQRDFELSLQQNNNNNNNNNNLTSNGYNEVDYQDSSHQDGDGEGTVPDQDDEGKHDEDVLPMEITSSIV
jgi:hypothetical protein